MVVLNFACDSKILEK